MESIKISITIPAYKGKYLKEAIESCLLQSYENFEIIIVDDASPENLEEIVNTFDDSRIRYFRNKENCGAVNVVDNWNKCLNYCNGDYIICMGDDDKLLPNCLIDYYNLIIKYPEVSVLHTWTEIIDENSCFIDIQEQRPEWESVHSFIWHRYNGRKKQYIGDFMFKTSELKSNGGFFKLPLAWSSDDVTAIREAAKAGVVNTQHLGFQYRENRSTISNSGNYDLKLMANITKKVWLKDFYNHVDLRKLSALDKKYYQLNINAIEKNFNERYIYYLGKDMKNRPYRLVKWLSHSWNLNISKKIILKAFGVSIIRSIINR